MFIWWSDKFFMFHNDAYLPALGKKHPEALGASARDMWAEIWEHLGVVAEGILENGNQFYAEEMLVLLDRKGFIEETYWTFSYSPIFNEAEKAEGVFCACNEVTGTVLGQRRLRTLKDLSEAMALVQTLEQACQVASEILSQDANDIPFNLIYLLNGNGTEAQLVSRAGNLTPENSPDTIVLAEGKTGKWPLMQVLRERKEVIVQYLSAEDFRGNGDTDELLPKQAVVLPIFRPGEEGIIGFFISGISPRLEYNGDYHSFHKLLAGQFATLITSAQAREELARQQEHLKELFEQAPVAITILNGPEYIVELANPGICELWGKKYEDVIGKPVLEVLPEVREQGIKELMDNVYRTGEPYVNNELPLMLNYDGQLKKVYVNFVYHPMRNAQGDITGIIVIAIGINEQVEARHEIEAMNKELLAINADLDNFVYSASHDLKAPISNIEGLMVALLENLPEETLASEEVQKLVKYIQGSIERFKRAVTDLTQVARIQRESNEDVASVNISEVVNETLLDFDNAIADLGAHIEKETPQHLNIQFSAKNARSIIYNLISNALKYHASDRELTIRITTEETADYTVLSVSDNGLGINIADEGKMFTMFKRLHDHVEGSGVGLYIVKKIVENAGGKIEVESQIGKGSTFRIFFPH